MRDKAWRERVGFDNIKTERELALEYAKDRYQREKWLTTDLGGSS